METSEPVTSGVIAILVDLLGIAADEAKPEASLRADLQCDELDLIEIVMNVEDRFSILLTEKEGDALTTVQSLFDLVTRKLDRIATPRSPRVPA